MRTHLSHALHIVMKNIHLPHGNPTINLTLFLTVHFHTVHGYTATHMCTTHVHAFLPFYHHHAVASCSYLDMPSSDSIGRFSTNMYIQCDSI